MFGNNDSNSNVTVVIDLMTEKKKNSAYAGHFMVHSLLLLHNYDKEVHSH